MRTDSPVQEKPRLPRLAAMLVIAFSLACSVAVGNANEATLTVNFIGLKSSRGAVMVALYNNEAAYERSATAVDTAWHAAKLEIKNGTAVLKLAALPPGQYAIKAYHDLNGDSKLNVNPFGIPKEPVAFSNDAPVHRRMPLWSETAFFVHAGQNAISIHIE